MELHEFASHILFNGDLESKLISKSLIDFKVTKMDYPGAELPELAARCEKLKTQEEQIKFPRKKSLKDDQRKGLALHFFANHELLATEMLAAAIVVFPCLSEEDIALKKTFLSTLADEQRHLEMYLVRMKDFGVELGDYPLNDFFWKYMKKVKTPHEFLSVLALTFESANLDFSLYYAEIFREIGDHQTADILDEIHRDEISHVAVGAHWLKKWRGDKELWNYYLEGLPEFLTPARAKGMIFDQQSRIKAGLDKQFVELLENYQDEFNITTRKEWKS